MSDTPETPAFFELICGNKSINIDLRTVCNITYKQEVQKTYGKFLKIHIKIPSYIEIMYDNGNIVKGGQGMTKSDYETIKNYWMKARKQI